MLQGRTTFRLLLHAPVSTKAPPCHEEMWSLIDNCDSLLLCCCDKYHSHTATWVGKCLFHLTLPVDSPPLKEVGAGTQAAADAGVMEKCRLMAYFLSSWANFCLQIRITNIVIILPIASWALLHLLAIKSIPQCPQANLIWVVVSHLKLPQLICDKLTAEANLENPWWFMDGNLDPCQDHEKVRMSPYNSSRMNQWTQR